MVRCSSVIGHFGEGKNLLNGQTIKTKIVTQELQNQIGKEQVLKFDTGGGWKTLLKAPAQVLSALKRSENILIFPAYNGLRVYTPLLKFFNRFFKRKLHYIVIGGWLPEFLKEKKELSKELKTFNGIYVETNAMREALIKQGFQNVFIMSNCKKLNILTESELIYPADEPYKLCTFSRVMKEKGIAEAVKAVKAVNEELGKIVFELDIYGQIECDQTEWFEELNASFPEYIHYKGLIPYDCSVAVLKSYTALLFPTFYEGEGFAGTIIDSFAAGVPVISSDWKYNAEIVQPHINGMLFETKNQTALVKNLRYIYENIGQFNKMKKNCIHEAEKYRPSNAMKPLLDNLTKDI